MSSASTTSSSPKFEAILNAALAKYKDQTKMELRNHPLASKIDACDSAESILAVFQEQAKAFDEFRNGDPKLFKWLQPVVTGLYALSTNPIVNTGVSFAFPPASAVFSGISVILSMPGSVKASYDALVEVFECMENFVRRLMIYTKIDRPTPAMTEVVIKIMVELISVLAIATKQINQGRFKKYGKRLLGENEIESVLQRLDRLTGEESKMATAQTLDVVYSLVNNMEVVMEDGKASMGDIHQTLVLMQEMSMKVNKMERDELQEKVLRWLSPPDPRTNHNTARKAHQGGTSTWLTQSEVFEQWKRTGGLLWIHGLPGSGKTVLSSSVIEEVDDMCRMGLAKISIFYFDFRDGGKQETRHLLSSILIQLCEQSDAFSKILSTLFMNHGRGFRQPSEDALIDCLTSMLKLSGQGPLYLVIDALDECPNSGDRSAILQVVEDLMNLQHPHVHLCITSRPEIDIRDVLEPLAVHNVPLHKQAGQHQDIVDYIKHYIHTHPKARRWQEKLKQLVIETLTEKAGGMFRWVQCQVVKVCGCLPPDIPRILNELPKTLDETYERILREIDEDNRAYANRLFQSLAVSVRPLRVEELAELFAINPNVDSTSELDTDTAWFRHAPEGPEHLILEHCSTLVDIVDVKGIKVVQFAHFSVKEYLASARIANSAHVSYFHFLPKPAHTLLARACLNTLLKLDYSIDETKIQDFPLARYAARYWVDHAGFEDVSSDIRDGMDLLFERNKPHFAAWIWVRDLDNDLDSHIPLAADSVYAGHPGQPVAAPLYYAALCGFRDLAERLLDAYPNDVNARNRDQRTPLHAALYNGHPNLAVLFLERGADMESRDNFARTALYVASSRGYADVVRSLIDRGADVNVECDDFDDEDEYDEDDDEDDEDEDDNSNNNVGNSNNNDDDNAESDSESEVYDDVPDVKWTPLLVASNGGKVEIARVLLEHAADVNHQDNFGRSPLHLASRSPSNDLTQLLLDHGANVNASDEDGRTALYDVSIEGQTLLAKLLLKNGANVHTQRNAAQIVLENVTGMEIVRQSGWTPLHGAASRGYADMVQLLLDHEADANAQSNDRWTALHLAALVGRLEVVETLLKRGADPHALTDKGQTPFQFASKRKRTQVMQLLSERTGEKM